MNFENLGLNKRIVDRVKEVYSAPTDVQEKVIPVMTQGKNVFVLSKTGSGKTAAFLLPIGNTKGKALILTPTRELAKQVWEEAKKLLPWKKTLVVYGGTSVDRDIERLNKHWDILIATPGRCLDHVNRGNLDRVDVAVLDEGDKMLEMGFLEDVTEILDYVEPKQVGLFSATLHEELKKLMDRDFETIKLEEDNFDIEHEKIPVERREKLSTLRNLLDPDKKTIIFMSRKKGVDWLSEKIGAWGIRHAIIHGDLSQRKRENMVGLFKNGKVNVIIATDVLARGIDIPDVDLVINYDEARDEKTHKHRIGRTGRIGKKGKAITLSEALPVFDANAPRKQGRRENPHRDGNWKRRPYNPEGREGNGRGRSGGKRRQEGQRGSRRNSEQGRVKVYRHQDSRQGESNRRDGRRSGNRGSRDSNRNNSRNRRGAGRSRR